MKYRPILFSTEMVKAILDGSKTQTRRLIKPQPKYPEMELKHFIGKWAYFETPSGHHDPTMYHATKKAEVGDIFWIREPVKILSHKKHDPNNFYSYKYDYEYISDGEVKREQVIPERITRNHINQLIYENFEGTWLTKHNRVPNGCLKEMARTFLKCINVRVERLQEISEQDAKAEGVKTNECGNIEGCVACQVKCKCEGEYWDYMDQSGETFPKYSAKESFFSLWESINGRESLESNPWVWVFEFSLTEKPELWP
ncbi:MAG: hypothetical protein AB3N18_06290 [Allomuricauda sp.]